MLRWAFLLLLLADALLFFWYAQQRLTYVPAEQVERAGVARIRLLSELSPGERLPARERVCLRYAPLSTAYEAERLVQLLMQHSVSASARPLPEQVVGYHLQLPLPADSVRRIAVLDKLAEQGWVPESRGGQLSFAADTSREAVERVRDGLPEELRVSILIVEEKQQDGRYEVAATHLVGYEISNEINQLIENSWPGIKIEKNTCEGVATPQGDQ